MKIVYLFDELTGEYKGEYIAQQSPLEPDVYIEPVHSTALQPLPIAQGKYNHFDGKKWTLKDDTRGVWYLPNRTTVEVNDLSEVIDPTWSRTEPPLTPSELSAIAALEAKAAKDAALNAITVTTVSGKAFDGNETARTNMLSAITAASFLGQTSANWKLADNTVALVTLDEVKEALALSIQRVGEIVTA